MVREKNFLYLRLIYRDTLAQYLLWISSLARDWMSTLGPIYVCFRAQWTSSWWLGSNTTKTPTAKILIFWFWWVEKLKPHMLFESYSHQSVFFKIVLSCWEHMLIPLLGPNRNCTLGSMTKSSILLKNQNVYFSL